MTELEPRPIREPANRSQALFQVDDAKTRRAAIEQTRAGGRLLWDAACHLLEAQRAAGRWFRDDPDYKQGKHTPSHSTVEYEALPSVQTIWRWQRAAAIPDDIYRAYLDECRETFDDPRAKRLKVPGVIGLLRFNAARRLRLVSENPPPLPDGTYRCLVVDPPWPIQRIETDVRENQPAAVGYPTMTLDEIEELPLGELAHDAGAHLYLWVTHRFLPAGLDLVESWGFRYQCLMTWVKTGRGGMTPFSWMYNTEHVIFARRGSLDLTRLGLKLSFTEPTTVHSAKPDVFYDRVLAASPEPRLEMFARRHREGFEAWGDEAPA